MAEAHRGPDNTIPELQRDNDVEGDALQFSTEASVAVRNESGTTLRVSFWKAASIEARVERVKELSDPNGLTALLEGRADERREKKADEDRQQYAQFAEILRDQAEERERWMRTPSTIGGVTLEGHEWEALGKRLREDDEFKSRVLALFMARGMSEREAEARYERVAEVSEIMAIPPSQRTEEQRRVIEKAAADPTFDTDMSDLQKARGNEIGAERKSDLSTSFAAAAPGSQRPAQAQEALPQQTVSLPDLGM